MPADLKNTIRLQAFLDNCGVASRRACEKIIIDGRVSVNGNVVTELGLKVSDSDVVAVDGKEVLPEKEKRYVLLNKPAGYVCSQSDEQGRPVAVDLLKDSFSERLYNVGRLDMFSTGAIIFTNEYIVESSLPLPRNLAENFKKGIRVDDVFYKAKDASELNSHKMRVVLVEGKNREIRRVFDAAGVAIRSLQRVRIGNLLLGNLGAGEFRTLSDFEVSSLLRICKTTKGE